MSRHYAYLFVTKEQRDIVDLPSGPEVVVPGTGPEAVASWQQAELSSLSPEERRQAESQAQQRALAVAAYERATDMWEKERDEHLAAIMWDKVRREKERTYEQERPRPDLDTFLVQAAGLDLADALEVCGPEIQQAAWWVATLRTSEPAADKTVPLCSAGESPYALLLALLERLANDGWEVVDVTTERVVRHGDVTSTTELSGMTYLLRR